MDDGIVGAGLGALAAADALIQVDVGAVIAEGNGILRADLLAGSRYAILAIVADLGLVRGPAMAGVRKKIDQRGLIILLRHRRRILRAPALRAPEKAQGLKSLSFWFLH